MLTAIIFDTEVTDLDDPEIIEAAWVEIVFGTPTLAGLVRCQQFKPTKPISLGAMCVHHIQEEDLQECADSAEFKLPACDYVIGHAVDFDFKAAGNPEGYKRICTLALSQALWPELDCHKLGALLYYFDRENARDILQHAHSADTDVLITKTVLDAIIAKTNVTSWEELWQASEKARVPTVMPFGKHRGEKICDVPSDYRAWLLKQPDVDIYLRQALEESMPSFAIKSPQLSLDLSKGNTR